jgi:hypothetical protein
VGRKKTQTAGTKRQMTTSDDKSRELLAALLQMNSTELEGFLIRLSAAELQAFVEIFSSGLTEKIKAMPLKPKTAKAKKLLSHLEGDTDENG